MSSWEKDKEKLQKSVSNAESNSINLNNTMNNTVPLPLAPVPPQIYYYQPLRPPVNPMIGYPTGYSGGYMPPNIQGYTSANGSYYAPASTQPYLSVYPPYAHVPVNMGYMQTPNSYGNAYQAPQQKPLSQNVPQVQKPQPVQNQKALQVKKPAQPPVQTQKKSITPAAQVSSTIAGYNLDDPEELEKWKAERRKKFPGAKKVEVVVESVKELSDQEEGALSEEVDADAGVENDEKETAATAPQKRKEKCKYFSRGKCNKGDSCHFEHITQSKKPKTENSSKKSNGSRSTIFENLLKIEEKESMIKFYECIKLIIRQ